METEAIRDATVLSGFRSPLLSVLLTAEQLGLKKPMEDEGSRGTGEQYLRLLAAGVQETQEGEGISHQTSPNITEHESGREEKGGQEQEDDFL